MSVSMRLGIKAKQVAGVVSIVGGVVVGLSLIHFSTLARVQLQAHHERGRLLADLIFQRARAVAPGTPDPYAALRDDPGLRSLLVSALGVTGVTYAAIVDPKGTVVAHSDQLVEGGELPPRGDLDTLLARHALAQLRALYSDEGRDVEFRQPILAGNTEFGTIRVGINTVLIRNEIESALRPAAITAVAALVISVAIAMLLAQVMLRPIHVIRSGLTRLGRGEFGVKLDLPQQDEFGELGSFFNAISAQLSADRSQLAGQKTHLESAVEHLEDEAAIVDPDGELLFANPAKRLEYLSRVQSTIAYSRKLVALGRLSAGVAHEVKNPLNAMTIHLELLKQKLSARGTEPSVLDHVTVIASEIRRLDQVMQGFLKFTRPEDLRLQPVALQRLLEEIVPVVEPEARKAGVELRVHCPADLPDINGDPAMLKQAFLNLALNACQAMPAGGTLRIGCAPLGGRRVEITFEDTGTGIKPEHLQKIFDLYFTTKEQGSGIGLSMVYRTVQMHDGDVEVQSTYGHGSTFRLTLPQA